MTNIRQEIKNEIQSFASVWDARECTEVILQIFTKLIDEKIAKTKRKYKDSAYAPKWNDVLQELKQELEKEDKK